MSKIKIEIEVGNDAMQTRAHLAALLAHMAEDGADNDESLSVMPSGRWPLRDTNGNTIGFVEYVE